jgi:hypothetical protein
MAYYVGVDVGLRRSSLCIVDELGVVCLERIVASEIEEIADAVRDFTECVEGLALETGNLAPWLAAGLRGEGVRVVVLEARQVKTTLSSLRNKTDRNGGVDPVLWTPERLHSRSPPCRNRDEVIHLSFVANWSSWCKPAVRPRSWRASLNPRHNRSGTGLPRLRGMLAAATAV